ncbi:tRNA-dihydrouridine(20) synthase [NAD(P)+] [Trichomonascus vanleenenianus]|uniref:tRNA-dihydrouridine(20) synthase (NAD(+)) n=1 Tax=Trichomonascus vanleenenianus TaxID=2268995 RepID=UPI003ECA75A6
MVNYRGGKLVLAPMVRVGELPTRLLSLRYGADLVWGPELIDKKIVGCKRVVNSDLKTVDFVEASDPSKVVFRTCEEERGKVVFQMGTATPELAVEAASIIAGDVAAIDVNSGCPKHFSIHSGMGAALLKKPDTLEAILRNLVVQVGTPNNIPISVKIRLLETPEKTYELVERLVKTGISLLTLHCRTTPMRPREPVIREALPRVVEICHAAGVACYVNGDVLGRWDLPRLVEQFGVDGAMVARAAEANASCFSEALQPWHIVAREFLDVAKAYLHHPSNVKFCLARVIPGKLPVYQTIARSKTVEDMDRGLAEYERDISTVSRKRPQEGVEEPPLKKAAITVTA